MFHLLIFRILLSLLCDDCNHYLQNTLSSLTAAVCLLTVLNGIPICFCITVCFYGESSVVQKKEVNSSLEPELGHLLSSGIKTTAYNYVAESYTLLIY